MITYIPKGKALAAMRFLDEEGAQYSVELSGHVDALKSDLRRMLEAAVRHELVDSEFRIRKGLKKHMLWFLTPKGKALMEQIRQVEGVVA